MILFGVRPPVCPWFLHALFFFFFQAEDGIRDTSVTGVQTCALPIFAIRTVGTPNPEVLRLDSLIAVEAPSMLSRQDDLDRFFMLQARVWALLDGALDQIGRASCRERV